MAGGKSAVNFELKEFRAREETIDLSQINFCFSLIVDFRYN